jgi:hypothetical protein
VGLKSTQVGVASVDRLGVLFDCARLHVHYPTLSDIVCSIKRHFYRTIQLQRGLRNFDYKRNIRRTGMRAQKNLSRPTNDRDIGFGLGYIRKRNRLLIAGEVVSGQVSREVFEKQVGNRCVQSANWSHFENFSFNQLYAISRVEYTCLTHTVILGHGGSESRERETGKVDASVHTHHFERKRSVRQNAIVRSAQHLATSSIESMDFLVERIEVQQ